MRWKNSEAERYTVVEVVEGRMFAFPAPYGLGLVEIDGKSTLVSFELIDANDIFNTGVAKGVWKEGVNLQIRNGDLYHGEGRVCLGREVEL